MNKKKNKSVYVTPVTPMPGEKKGDYEKRVEERKRKRRELKKQVLKVFAPELLLLDKGRNKK